MDLGYQEDDGRMRAHFGQKNVAWRWAMAGEKSYTKEQAKWKQLIIYNTVHNGAVGHMFPSYFEEGFFDLQVPASEDPLSIEPRLYWESINKYEGKQPEEVVLPLIHGFEEGKEYGQIRSPIKDYVNESVARFVVGDLDVNSNSDWNDYLSELQSYKLDRFVEILQIAYDRMYR